MHGILDGSDGVPFHPRVILRWSSHEISSSRGVWRIRANTMAMTHDLPWAQVQPNRVSFNSMMSAFEKGHQWEMATWIYASKCCCFFKGTGSKVAKYMYIYIYTVPWILWVWDKSFFFSTCCCWWCLWCLWLLLVVVGLVSLNYEFLTLWHVSKRDTNMCFIDKRYGCDSFQW